MHNNEQPILTSYAQFSDVYTYLDDGTPVERRPIQPGELWVDYASIPATAPTPSPWPGTAGVFTVGILDESLTGVPGQPRLFQSTPPSRLSLIMPGNFQNRAYRPTLADATGRVIPYNPSVWVADGIELVVAFKYQTPQALGYQTPLRLTYWLYTGAIGGGGGGGATLANEGPGPGFVFDQRVAGVDYLRGIGPADPGITVATVGNTVVVGNTLSGANLGAGAGIFAAKSGASLQMRSLVAGAGSGVTVTQNADDVTIGAATGSVVSVANEGGGAGVFDAVVGTTANLRSLVGTANGLTVTEGASTITVDNTLTGANLGAGAALFAAKSGASLQFRSLVAGAGSGLTATQNANDVTLAAAAGSVVTMTNIGGGIQIFSSVVANVAQLRTLVGSVNGLSVSLTGGTITIDNTMNGVNLPGGAEIFSTKSGANLQFRNLAANGDASGMVVATSGDSVVFDASLATWTVQDREKSGEPGGRSSDATVHTRTLNTITSAGEGTDAVQLDSDILRISAGRYFVTGTVANRAGEGVAAWLYNLSDDTIAVDGVSTYNRGELATVPATFAGFLSLREGGRFVVQQWITVGRDPDGLGAPASVPGKEEVYVNVTIVRLAQRQ